jgi:thiamine kinase-like enzyme
MQYIHASVSIEEVLAFPLSRKKEFVGRIKEMMFSLHQSFENFPKRLDLKREGTRAERLKGLSSALIKALAACLESQDLSRKVLVHGDITRDNVLLDSNGRLTLIDFADCIVAPDYYELPAVIFELFLCDKALVSLFVGDADEEEFLDTLIKGLSLHIFCGNILKDYFKRLHMPMDAVKSVDELKQLLRSQFFSPAK